MLVESPIRVAKKALLGTMLGDSSLAINSQKTKASFRMNHSVSQLPYAIWKLHILIPIIGPVSIKSRYVFVGLQSRHDGDIEKEYTAVHASSIQSVYLKHIYNDFYFERNGKVKKEVHINVLNRLDPMGLAMWYQDDGGVQSRNGQTISSISLAVCGFSDQEIELIKDYFKRVWCIDWKIKTMTSGYKVLIASGDSMRSFIEIIRPHVCPWMSYKINSSDSAKHLSIEEGDDMIRSFEQSKELSGNIQLYREESVIFDDDDTQILSNERITQLQVPYGISLSDDEMKQFQTLILSSKYRWGKMTNVNGTSWYLFLNANTDNLISLRKKFGGYIRNYGNNAEYRIGGRSAFRMCNRLMLNKLIPQGI